MKKRKSIRGSQTPTPTPPPIDPNDLAPECILVDKVYDWVFFANDYENKNFIPDEACRLAVSEALAAGETVTTECTPSDPEDVNVTATIIENGNPGLVRLVWTVPVEVTILINGNVACTFTVTTQFTDEIMLCVPVGITADNINAKATQVICRTDGVLMGPDPFGPMIPVRVVLCKDVQVEFPVKLEVLAKFCFPRPNNIKKPRDIIKCDLSVFEFPEQCPDIFPPANCECQATALARNADTTAMVGGGIMLPGTSDLEAEVCQECSIGDTFFTYSFMEDPDLPGPTPTGTVGPTPSPFDFRFTFEPSSVNTVRCDEATETLTAFGEGTQIFNNGTELVGYQLIIDNTNSTFQIILRNTAGEIVFDSGLVTALTRFEECDTFQDLLDDDM
ncbi:hypothetical protein ACFFGV_00200 [Pontibacillus salicampi]|uniref:DUF3794 domain-containing protein n=1 Tax=Pontibacillus salicampi TaxID=1449801 RepID=A0ABV6LI05_9BACI